MFVLRKTQFGRHTYAIGGNMEAALRTGIPVDRHIIMLYMLSASTAGIAGFLSTLRFTAGSAVIGDPLLLPSIAAVIIGGVSLFGGAGTVIGTVIGALIIAVLTTGLVMLNVEAFWQFIVVGSVVIVAVLIDQSRDLIIGRPTETVSAMTDPILSVRNLTKRFGGLVAVNDVSWDVYPGEVVALLGDNGAGKSTLIKCISGVYQADEGEIFFRGERTRFARPIDARAKGIETIYQDLALANNLDVSANIFLGREMKLRYFGGLIRTLDEADDADASRRRRSTRSRSISPTCTQPIESLSGGQRQAVAIARAVYWDAQADDHGRADQQPRRPRAAEGARADPPAARPGRAGHPDHPHAARRLRRRRPADGHAPRPKGDREEDGRDQHRGAGPVHGRRARRHARLRGQMWHDIGQAPLRARSGRRSPITAAG